RQPEIGVGARVDVAHEQLLPAQMRFDVGLEALELLRRDRLIHLPHQIRCVESGSSTRNLSFGLRPVCGDVMAANGPPPPPRLFVTIPSPRRRACSYSWVGVRFRCRRCSVEIPIVYLVERTTRRCSKASTAAITAIFTMSGTSDNRCKT